MNEGDQTLDLAAGRRNKILNDGHMWMTGSATQNQHHPTHTAEDAAHYSHLSSYPESREHSTPLCAEVTETSTQLKTQRLAAGQTADMADRERQPDLTKTQKNADPPKPANEARRCIPRLANVLSRRMEAIIEEEEENALAPGTHITDENSSPSHPPLHSKPRDLSAPLVVKEEDTQH